MATLGLDNRSDGQVWHLPTAQNTMTGKEMVAAISQAMGKPNKLQPLGNTMVSFLGLFIPILREVREMMYQYNHDYRFSSAKYKRVFGDVAPMDYLEGVKQTSAFYGGR
jgi:nucleoside-diphosphate-sugar epimerase